MTMVSTQDYTLLVIDGLLAIECRKQNIKKTRKIVYGVAFENKAIHHVNLLKELRIEPTDYHDFLRMNKSVYLKLLSMVTPLIQKKDTIMKRSVSAHERLTATLRFLATGCSYECLKFPAIVSPQALGKIIPETCDAIYKVLRKEYLQVSTVILIILCNWLLLLVKKYKV